MADERKLADVLVELNDGGDGAPNVAEATARERRRVRRWAIATTLLWILAAAYFLGLLWSYMVFIHPVLNEFLTNPAAPARDNVVLGKVLIVELKALLFWPVLLAMAAISTTLFTLTSRRATLRQIQVSLANISAELKRISTT